MIAKLHPSFSKQKANCQYCYLSSMDAKPPCITPLVCLHYLVNRWWEYSNLSVRSCHLDLTPNQFNKKNAYQLRRTINNQILEVKGLK